MQKKLGILVASRDNMRHVLGLAKAAKAAGKFTDIFFTGDGVHLTQHPHFRELVGIARVGVCEASYFNRGYRGIEITGLVDKDFTTQGRNAEILEECEQYLIM
ncbi:peroxiredoxin [candidate division KSB1 bacterium]